MEVTGESAESGAYRGLGVRPSSGRDFGGYSFFRTCRVKVIRLSLEVAGVSSAFEMYKGFGRSWRITGLRPNFEEKEFGQKYQVKRVAAEGGTRRGFSPM